MAIPRQFKCADWGGEIDDIKNNQGSPLFKSALITWSIPKIWLKGEPAPIGQDAVATDCIYCLIRDHHRAKSKVKIVYVGITRNIAVRFANHPKAKLLRDMRGDTSLSVGSIDFGKNWRQKGSKQATEQLEHLLIWALRPKYNERKTYMLPGMGKHPARPWKVENKGFRFAGTMPRELVYPWMLVKPGRDRSKKRT